MLTGPNITRCTGNGEWEPDPREAMCLGQSYSTRSRVILYWYCNYSADCGVPLVDSTSGLNVTYSSTMEGSVAVVLCDEIEVTALCHRNGHWSPQLTDGVCNSTASTTTGIIHNY